MLFKPKGVDIHVESRARDQARWLIRDHGDEAEEVLRAKLCRERISDADRYRYKLTLREIGRLRRSAPEKYGRGKSPGLAQSFKDLFS
jgi:hypothetical protein